MSKFLDMRTALKASLIAADIGWEEENVIINRQGSLFNDLATALNASKHGVALHIGVASGSSTEDEDLEMDLTIPLTIVCLPEVVDGATPEEDLWEGLVRHVHDLRLGYDLHSDRFRFKGFLDLDIRADDGTSYLGRQTTFAKHLSLSL